MLHSVKISSSWSSDGTLEEHSRLSQDWRGRTLGWRQSTGRRSVDARSTREWSSEAAARAICPNSLRQHCCISEETGGWLVCEDMNRHNINFLVYTCSTTFEMFLLCNSKCRWRWKSWRFRWLSECWCCFTFITVHWYSSTSYTRIVKERSLDFDYWLYTVFQK